MIKKKLCSMPGMGCGVVCRAEPTVVIGLWLVKERELSGFSPSDKRWATPNSSTGSKVKSSSGATRPRGDHPGPASYSNNNQ